jgi:LmbE family N-acetylglucosaminyl deacetylase
MGLVVPGRVMQYAETEGLHARASAIVRGVLDRVPWRRGTVAGVVLARMSALPFAGIEVVAGTAAPLVLAPHPDDESLGCGGLIAACCARGTPPVVAVLTDGAMSHPGSRAFPAARLAEIRAAETREAVAALGMPRDRLHFLGLPDGRAPRDGAGLEQAAACVAALARAAGATTILATWEHDPHPDHVAAQAIARRAAALAGARVVSYPVWGWALPPRRRLPIDEVTGVRIDIARHLPAKRRAIAAHASQAGGVIHDDAEGFRLPPALLDATCRPFEVYLLDR